MARRNQLTLTSVPHEPNRVFGRVLGVAAFAASVAIAGCVDQAGEAPAIAERAADLELRLEIEHARERFELSQLAISPASIRFTAGAEDVELALTPNTQLLAADAVIERDGERLTPAEAGVHVPLRGHVVGDPNSWVRVQLTPDGFEGLIYKDQDLWDIRELDTGEIWMAKADIRDYLDSPSYGQHRCANTDGEAEHATYVAHDGAAAAKSCAQISLSLTADYTHVAALGGASASENEMIARINEADGIFRADLNYGFVVGKVQSLSKAGGPSFNQAAAGSTPLTQFAAYKQSELSGFGLAHLFVARTKHGAVGMAYVGATCSPRYGSGVSNYLGKGRSSTIVATHELGHNFGADHDKSGSAYVMAPSVNSLAQTFSSASESDIDSHVGSVSCFTPCTSAPAPAPAPSTCSGACGGKAASGCWCDSQCSEYGDCCADHAQVCE